MYVGDGVREGDGDCEAEGVGVLVLVLVGVVPPLHLNVTCASSDTGASLSPRTQAIFLKLISLVGQPGSCAVTQYTIWPDWFICILPTLHCIVLFPAV